MTTPKPQLRQMASRARDLEPAARAEFLRQLPVPELVELHAHLVGESKPKTPRPVLERRILGALEETPPEPAQEVATAAAPPAPAPRAPAPAAPPELRATTEADSRMPAIGTVVIKRNRQGGERARCIIVAGGIEYAGSVYASISGAALAAAHDLGLKVKTLNGWDWWGLQERPRVVRAKKDAGGAALERLQRDWARYRARLLSAQPLTEDVLAAAAAHLEELRQLAAAPAAS